VVASTSVRSRTHNATVPQALGAPRPRVHPGDVWRIRTRSHLIVRDGCTCHYCGCMLGTRSRMGTLDHIWPVSFGRIDARWNLVLACGTCNSTRGTSSSWCSCGRCLMARFAGSIVTRLRAGQTRAS